MRVTIKCEEELLEGMMSFMVGADRTLIFDAELVAIPIDGGLLEIKVDGNSEELMVIRSAEGKVGEVVYSELLDG